MALEKLVAGDTLDFTDTVPDYPPADGWTLKYRLIPQFSTPTQAPVTLTASTSGTDYRVQASPAVTASWVAGTYSWARWVEKSGARQTLDPITPLLTLVDDPSAVVQGYDPRTPARIALDAINANLSAFGSQAHIQEYTIGNRSMRYATQADLLVARSALMAEVWREEIAVKMRAGLPNPRYVQVRLGRV